MNNTKSKVGGWIMLILGSILAIRTGTNVYRLWKAGDQVVEQKQAVKEAWAENERLKKELAKAADPATVEKEAREKLGYGRPGETIVIIPKEEKQNSNNKFTNSQNNEANWEKWWRLYIRI